MPENAGQNQGRWEKGQSGNPRGKPRGARNRATLLAEALLDGEAEALNEKRGKVFLSASLSRKNIFYL